MRGEKEGEVRSPVSSGSVSTSSGRIIVLQEHFWQDGSKRRTRTERSLFLVLGTRIIFVVDHEQCIKGEADDIAVLDFTRRNNGHRHVPPAGADAYLEF